MHTDKEGGTAEDKGHEQTKMRKIEHVFRKKWRNKNHGLTDFSGLVKEVQYRW